LHGRLRSRQQVAVKAADVVNHKPLNLSRFEDNLYPAAKYLPYLIARYAFDAGKRDGNGFS
jgi:hypothetical protein